MVNSFWLDPDFPYYMVGRECRSRPILVSWTAFGLSFFSFLFNLSCIHVLRSHEYKNRFDRKHCVMGRLKRGGLPEKKAKAMVWRTTSVAIHVDGVHKYSNWILAA